jgi:hypothetical protein
LLGQSAALDANAASTTSQRCGDQSVTRGRRVQQGDVSISSDLLAECALGQLLFVVSDLAPCGRNAKAFGKSGNETLINGVEIGQGAAQDLAHGDDALCRRIDGPLGKLLRRHIEASQHLSGVEVDEQRPLIENQITVEEAASAADLAAIDFDIVARPVVRRHAEFLQPKSSRLADAPGHLGEVHDSQGRAIEDKFPADLPIVEIEAAAAGNPTHRFDAVRVAVIELELMTEILMDADEGRRTKAQKPDRVGNLPLPACLDQRLIESDIGASAAQSRGDDAEWSAFGGHLALLVCCSSDCSQALAGRACRRRPVGALCECRGDSA